MNASNPSARKANDVLDEVASWIERRDRENWSAADQAELDEWLAQSPAHLVEFLRTNHAWARADRLGALRTEPRKVSSSNERPPRARRGMLAATGLILVGSVATAGLTFVRVSAPAEKIYSTPVGGHAVLSLADGSRIELNTDSSVRISRDGVQRLVKLDRGEAFFDIKHDTARPFVVLAAKHRVTDIGTKFVVRERGKNLEVSLVEGQARIESDDANRDAAVLDKGDVAIATDTNLSVRKVRSDSMLHTLAWRHGVLMFDNTTLAEAAQEFNRYNEHKLVIAGKTAARLTITGTFHSNDVRAFAEVAEDILHVRVRVSNTDTVISR